MKIEKPSVRESSCQQIKSFSICTRGGQSSDKQDHASNDTLLRLSCMVTFILPYHLSCLKISEKVVFLCEQHHADENVSVNYITVCATRGYINAANLWRSRSRCIHHSTTNTKLMHFIQKCLVIYFS